MRSRSMAALLLGLAGLWLTGCAGPCIRNSDCPAGQSCQKGQCLAIQDMGGPDGMHPDLTGDQRSADLAGPADLKPHD